VPTTDAKPATEAEADYVADRDWMGLTSMRHVSPCFGIVFASM
jgi:hypothetical protein